MNAHRRNYIPDDERAPATRAHLHLAVAGLVGSTTIALAVFGALLLQRSDHEAQPLRVMQPQPTTQVRCSPAVTTSMPTLGAVSQ